LHGETSISWTSPPSYNYILSLLSPPCQEKEILGKYDEYRGWSEEGIPTQEKLKDLGLLK
jgi:hypothetical protein